MVSLYYQIKKGGQISVYKYDYYTNYNCVSGNCPLMVEEEKYGIRSSTCDDYCGTGFGGCSTCYFEESDSCNECVHNKVGNK